MTSPKPCRSCGREPGFPLRSSRMKRRDYVCRSCEKSRGHVGTAEARVLSAARLRAETRGVPFTLDRDNLPPEPDTCPCCGQIMERGSMDERDNSPSLDRLVPEAGYTPENVLWLCSRCNTLKRDSTPVELYRLADWLWDEYKKRGLPLPSTRLRPHGEEK